MSKRMMGIVAVTSVEDGCDILPSQFPTWDPRSAFNPINLAIADVALFDSSVKRGAEALVDMLQNMTELPQDGRATKTPPLPVHAHDAVLPKSKDALAAAAAEAAAKLKTSGGSVEDEEEDASSDALTIPIPIRL